MNSPRQIHNKKATRKIKTSYSILFSLENKIS